LWKLQLWLEIPYKAKPVLCTTAILSHTFTSSCYQLSCLQTGFLQNCGNPDCS
jgi:hypothetical protein